MQSCSRHSKSVLGGTQLASLKVGETEFVSSEQHRLLLACDSSFSPWIVSSIAQTCGPSELLPYLALSSLQADVKLGQPAQGPHATPAAGGQFILHCTQHDFASLSAPGRSSPEDTAQVWHALLHTDLCGPKQSSCS